MKGLGRAATLAVGLVLVVACSSSSSGGGGGASSNSLTCGNGSLSGQARATDVVSLGPIAGATVSAPGCTTATTDDRGYITAASDPGLLIKLSLTASGYVNAYTEVTVLQAGFAETGADYKATDAANLISQLSSSSGYLYVGVGGDGSDGGPCSSGTGATVSLDGHPELAPSYLTNQTTIDTSGTATEGFGTIFGPMPPGSYSMTATKTGCKSVGRNDGYFAWGTTMTVSANTASIAELQLAAQ